MMTPKAFGKLVWVGLVLAIAGSPGMPAHASDILPKYPMPVLISPGDFTAGQTDAASSVRLPDRNDAATLRPSASSVFAAAYYADSKVLVVVERSGVCRLYQEGGAYFRLTHMKSPWARSRTDAVHFSRVPGLFYVLTIDEEKEEELKGSRRQEYPDRYDRVDYSRRGDPRYEGVPVDNAKEKVSVLEAYYCSLQNEVCVVLPDGKEVILKMSSELAKPFRTGPFKSLAQAVYIFPENGIVSKTVAGWAVCGMDGKLLREFSDERVHAMGWQSPICRNGDFLVVAQMGPVGAQYKLDIKSGQMIQVSK